MKDLKTYVGTKVVYAKPMTRADYNTYRDWETDRKSTRLNSSHS